jgi:NADH-quinone oxidoreductase subunit N
MISLGYYLPVVAAMWRRAAPAGAAQTPRTQPPTGTPLPGGGPLPALAGGSPELDAAGAPTSGVQGEVVFVALLAAAATIFFGIIPQPLFDLVHHAGSALSGLF